MNKLGCGLGGPEGEGYMRGESTEGKKTKHLEPVRDTAEWVPLVRSEMWRKGSQIVDEGGAPKTA